MIGKLFGTKNEMRRALSMKKPRYNSRSEYSRLTKLQFAELKVFWKYIDSESKKLLIRSAKSSTQQGTEEWERVRKTVNDYEVKGPMGSMGPTLPIDLKDLESKILGEDNTLRECWGEKNIYTWADRENKQAKMHKPTKRAAATVGRARLPGEKCISRTASKANSTAKLQKLRSLLDHHFKLLSRFAKMFSLTWLGRAPF